jgi:hypothetical protein
MAKRRLRLGTADDLVGTAAIEESCRLRFEIGCRLLLVLAALFSRIPFFARHALFRSLRPFCGETFSLAKLISS